LACSLRLAKNAGQDWALAAMTHPGAAQLITMTVMGDYLSSHTPEEGPGGVSKGLHTMARRQPGQVLCYACQEPGHVIANCPHRAESKGAPGMKLAETNQARHISAQTTVRKTWRTQWMQPDDVRRWTWLNGGWQPPLKIFSSCPKTST